MPHSSFVSGIERTKFRVSLLNMMFSVEFLYRIFINVLVYCEGMFFHQ